MKKIRFINYYGKFNTKELSVGNQDYGNYLGYLLVELSRILESKFEIETVFDDSFDIVVFIDLDKELFDYANKLSNKIKKILLLVESPIYTPFPHSFLVINNTIWHKVLTYNREFKSPNINYYDIPITCVQMEYKINTIEYDIPCHIASFKNDTRGFTKERDTLLLKLAKQNKMHIYGSNWPSINNYLGKTNDKINTISKYKYYLAMENAKYSGYVTEKIADAILAERPSIYFGDFENAQKRFPNTFVNMQNPDYKSFLEAEEKLLNNYDFYYQNVLEQKNQSEQWIESFITNMIAEIIE